MKNILFIITISLGIISCGTTRDSGLSRAEQRAEKKLAEQQIVKKAIESRRFIVKLDKLYFSHGGMIELMPRANYIIVDGNKSIISAAYLGRQYEIKPIAALNLFGKTKTYELTNHVSNGNYEIKMQVDNGTNIFDVYLSISKNGFCRASFNTLRIDNVSYAGHIVPIKDKVKIPLQDTRII